LEVCAVRPPGRERRLTERSFRRVGSLVQALADALPVDRVPFALFGHSMGALVCFELARELRRRGALGPLALFVAGRPAPQIIAPDQDLHRRPDAEFVEELRRLGGTPAEALQNADLMELVLEGLRADIELCETYSYTAEPPLDCPITAFAGEVDEIVRTRDVRRWREQTRGRFDLHALPGGHFFVESSREALLATIAADLESPIERTARS
jgi:medium-chain acyl-[acyl-carrier-protein] hydrolase